MASQENNAIEVNGMELQLITPLPNREEPLLELAKKRTGDPWMPAPEYAHGLSGTTFNILVADVQRTVAFAKDVLGYVVIYDDPDFAILDHDGAHVMLHADHTYEQHPFALRAQAAAERGNGIEIRVHHCDPDVACARADTNGYRVLAGAADKPHGLREAYIEGPEGYVWVPDVPI